MPIHEAFPIGIDRVHDFMALTPGAGDPLYVRPLRQPLEAELTGESAFARYGAMELFGVEVGGRLVARAAAIVNPRLVDEDGAPIGQVGYFESEDDPDAASALFDATFGWLRAKGARRVMGPMNGGAHRSHRLMTDGFGRPPILFEPRNPAWYPKLFEANGFAPIHSWLTFELDEQEVRRLQRIVTRATSGLPRVGIVDPLDPRRPEVIPRFHALLDRVWKDHIGYAHIDLDELVEVFGGALALMSDRHFCIVHDEGGRDLACSFMFPDYIEAVRALDGDATRWGSWLGGPVPEALVMHTHAVAEEARHTNAVSLGLYRGINQFYETAHTRLVIALVTDEWKFFERHARPTRKYALYGRALP